MESAPLTAAHTLARDITQNVSPSTLAAAEKHKAVALEFSKAAEGVEDTEALRVLNLLEQHHQRLAQIISSGFERTSAQNSGRDNDAGEQLSHKQSSDALLKSNVVKSMSHVTGPSGAQPSASPAQQRRHPREMSSSIASNLANARGIPTSQHRSTGQPLSSTTRNERKETSVYSTRTATAAGLSRSRSGVRELQTSRGTISATKAISVSPAEKPDMSHEVKVSAERQSDDPFQKFYATFEGLLTKLSAPLAFAGLPLVPEGPTHELKPNPSPNIMDVVSNSELTNTSPEISKIFSKAALRAVKEDHGGPGVQESFLVVPTGGGTVSYASILSRAERQSRQPDPSLEHGDENNEHFVDARELPDMQSPKMGQQVGTVDTSPLKKNAEELRIENESLKQLTDNLSRRLYMWEKSAQSQSMALHQSIRNLQPPSRMPSEPADDERHNGEHGERTNELEEQFMAAQRELERYGRENEKLRTVVMRYRERWEKLKEGARVRREGAEKGIDTPVSES